MKEQNQEIEKPLPDVVVLPVMEKHNVTREEAEKRLRLLSKSCILTQGSPDDINSQRQIDQFLALDSSESAPLVAFDICLNTCMANADFVRAYDRLTFNNFGKSLKLVNAGTPPKNFMKQLEQFGEYVRKAVFERMLNSTDES